MLFFALIEYRAVGRIYENFWHAKFAGSIIGLLFIVLVYDLCTRLFRVHAEWIPILIFFLAAGAGCFLELILLKNGAFSGKPLFLPLGGFFLIAELFILFTFVPPKIPLFLDPSTGKYGITC